LEKIPTIIYGIILKSVILKKSDNFVATFSLVKKAGGNVPEFPKALDRRESVNI
jgi:hypothetical protein